MILTATDDIAMFPKSLGLYGIKSEENAKKENKKMTLKQEYKTKQKMQRKKITLKYECQTRLSC